MQINNDIALKQYNTYGKLATLRQYRYEEGRKIRITAQGKYLGEAWVLKVVDLYRGWQDDQTFEGMIYPYLEASGFPNTKEWTRVAKQLHKAQPRWLVLIQKYV